MATRLEVSLVLFAFAAPVGAQEPKAAGEEPQ
jgi:hypothetical protein